MSAQKQHILIIGGGLAGLALAQALRKLNIQSTVYERDSNAFGRKQSWAVSLEACLPGMKAMLPDDLGPIENISNNRKLGVPDIPCMMDASTGVKLVNLGGAEKYGDPGFFLHANRIATRAWLAQNLEIQWNKKFERYEEDESGVTAFFEDSTSVRGTSLVGVDGSGSRIRAQLLDNAEAHLLPYGVIAAEYEVSLKDAAAFRKDSTAFQIALKDGVLAFVGLRDHALSDSAMYYYHVYWTDHAVTKDGTSYWTQTATKERLRAKVDELTAGWRGTGKYMIDRCRAEDMVQPPFLLRKFMPPDSLPRGRVTLMGDAAHTMPPFRGLGANTALQDAMDLARLLQKDPERDIKDLFKEYEAAMIPRGQQVVEVSSNALIGDPTGEEVIKAMKAKFASLQKGGSE